MMTSFSRKALLSLGSLFGVVDQMFFCWEISMFLRLLLFMMKYRPDEDGSGGGDGGFAAVEGRGLPKGLSKPTESEEKLED